MANEKLPTGFSEGSESEAEENNPPAKSSTQAGMQESYLPKLRKVSYLNWQWVNLLRPVKATGGLSAADDAAGGGQETVPSSYILRGNCSDKQT